MQILRESEVVKVPGFARKLADLMRISWTGSDGRCYFPYLPLTTAEFWQCEVTRAWTNGEMLSWVGLEGTEIIGHSAIVFRQDGAECGRLTALPGAPYGTATTLANVRFDFAREQGIDFRVECTQAHTSTQKICRRRGLRFAGIGILKEIDGIAWDIIYFDSLLALPDFAPSPGVLGNPHGRLLHSTEEQYRRLHEISGIISTDRGGTLPPKFFHTLPELVPVVREIIRLNLP